jgi:cyclomaltodextrinase
MNLDHAIWWHVYPLGALGAPIHQRSGHDAGHRLPGLLAWLDYAVELGCSGLLLGPVFASTSHGYDTVDHFRIDPRLGDEGDFDLLVAEAGGRGLGVLLDGVFNHVGAEHPAVASRDGLVRRDHERLAAWEGHADLVELDHQNPEVADLVTAVMLHWLRRGIAGWRLDVAYAVPPQFWREVLGRVRAEFPDAVFVGELLHGDYAGIAGAGTLDSVTQYELWKAIWSSLKDDNFWELAWALERHDAVSAQLVAQTFLGNHDVSRIASQVDEASTVLAVVILLTLPGMPSLYYGDEQGFRGEKGEGISADDPLRPPLPATPAGLAPDGWWLYRLHQELIGLRRRHPWLARGRVGVVGKDCSWITYETTGAAGTVLRVELNLEPHPAARVILDGVTAFVWPR